MKNFTIGLNVFLVAAVAILFYLHFSSTKKSTPTLQANKQEANNNFKIAYLICVLYLFRWLPRCLASTFN